MFYAHAGQATDGSFNDRRKFYAFATKAERIAAQNKIWNDSDCERNLIFCSRKLVEIHTGRNFAVVDNGLVLNAADEQQYYEQKEQKEATLRSELA